MYGGQDITLIEHIHIQEIRGLFQLREERYVYMNEHAINENGGSNSVNILYLLQHGWCWWVVVVGGAIQIQIVHMMEYSEMH